MGRTVGSGGWVGRVGRAASSRFVEVAAKGREANRDLGRVLHTELVPQKVVVQYAILRPLIAHAGRTRDGADGREQLGREWADGPLNGLELTGGLGCSNWKGPIQIRKGEVV